MDDQPDPTRGFCLTLQPGTVGLYDLYSCNTCGAVVLETDLHNHRQWHLKLTSALDHKKDKYG